MSLTAAVIIACIASCGAGVILALAWVEARTRRRVDRVLGEVWPARNPLDDDTAQMAMRLEDQCGARTPKGFSLRACDRLAGHRGRHVARDAMGGVWAAWDQEEATR